METRCLLGMLTEAQEGLEECDPGVLALTWHHLVANRGGVDFLELPEVPEPLLVHF